MGIAPTSANALLFKNHNAIVADLNNSQPELTKINRRLRYAACVLFFNTFENSDNSSGQFHN